MNIIGFSKIFMSICLAAALSVPVSCSEYRGMVSSDGVSAAVSQSGQCGPDLMFDIKDGVLTVSGTGPMYTDLSVPLWDRSGVKSVVIGNGVTAIGDFAFSHMDKLENISISDTVKTIGNNAFSFCKSLQKVDFGAGIENINAESFADCTSLKSVILKDKVKTIGDKAFYHCFWLKEITLPESVSSIGKKAFLYCGTGEAGADTKTVYNFTSYTVRDSYAAKYIEFLDKLADIESETPDEKISPYEYYDMVCLSLGSGIYYKLVKPDTYNNDCEVSVCYMPDIQSNPGDMFGVMFGQEDKEENYSSSPVIKKHSDYKAEKIYTMGETVRYDKSKYLFGTVDSVYSNTCMTVTVDSNELFVICDSTAQMEPGKDIAFVLSEGISGENMNVCKSEKIIQTCCAHGISLGYNKEIDSTLFLKTVDKSDKNSLDNSDYFYLCGINVPAGKNGFSVLFEEYTKSVAEIPVISLYKTSFAADAKVIHIDESEKSEPETGMLSARFTDNGGLVYLNKTDKIYLLNGIPDQAKPGDMLSFSRLNSVEKGVYYAADVQMKKDIAYQTGDVNYDGKVNVFDLIMVKSCLVTTEVKNVDKSYDIDGDTYFSVKDAMQLVKILLGSK